MKDGEHELSDGQLTALNAITHMDGWDAVVTWAEKRRNAMGDLIDDAKDDRVVNELRGQRKSMRLVLNLKQVTADEYQRRLEQVSALTARKEGA